MGFRVQQGPSLDRPWCFQRPSLWEEGPQRERERRKPLLVKRAWVGALSSLSLSLSLSLPPSLSHSHAHILILVPSFVLVR